MKIADADFERVQREYDNLLPQYAGEKEVETENPCDICREDGCATLKFGSEECKRRFWEILLRGHL